MSTVIGKSSWRTILSALMLLVSAAKCQQYGNLNSMQQPSAYGNGLQMSPQYPQQQQFLPSNSYGVAQPQPAYSPLSGSANQMGYPSNPAPFSQFPQQQLSYPTNQLQTNGYGNQQFPVQQQSPTIAYNPNILPNSIQDVLGTGNGNGMYSPLGRGLNTAQQIGTNGGQQQLNNNAMQQTGGTVGFPGQQSGFNGQQVPQQQQFFPQNQQFPQVQNGQLMNQGGFQQQQPAAFPSATGMTHQDQSTVTQQQQQNPSSFASATGNVPAVAKAGMT